MSDLSLTGILPFFASVTMICTITSGLEPSESSFGYFTTTCGVIILTIICYLGLPQLEWCFYYQQL